MDQSTHTCLAVRAIGLLEDSNADPNLVALLKRDMHKTAIGAWMPDLQDTKKGSGKIDNHVLKMKPMAKRDPYFAMGKKELLAELGDKRSINDYLMNDTVLGVDWWNESYKATPAPGQHLGNRANALAIAIADLLIIGDNDLDALVPGTVSFANQLDDAIRTKPEQAGLYFFMLSHFIADSCMPMHCDARKLNGFSAGLHHEWEMHWSGLMPNIFNKKKILTSTMTSDEIIQESKNMDGVFGITFKNEVPDLAEDADVWKEIIMMCRGSFALSCIVNPLTAPFDINQKGKKFKEIEGSTLLKEIDAVVLHDAVLSIAIIWKSIWSKFADKKTSNKQWKEQ
jgi:hypothetical protein